MLWYSFLDKRGDFIKKLINWQLFINGDLHINNESVECEYEKNKFIKYKEKDAINIIDIEKKVYIRENSEFKYTISVLDETFSPATPSQ